MADEKLYLVIAGYFSLTEQELPDNCTGEELKNRKEVWDPYQDVMDDIKMRVCDMGLDSFYNWDEFTELEDYDEEYEEAFVDFITKYFTAQEEKGNIEIKEVDFTWTDDSGCVGYDYEATINLDLCDLWRKFRNKEE